MAVCVLQKQKKYLESKQKALVARNEYLLSLDTANAAIQRYYCDDLHNIINVCRIKVLCYILNCAWLMFK